MIGVHLVEVELVEDGLVLVGQRVGAEFGRVEGGEGARLRSAKNADNSEHLFCVDWREKMKAKVKNCSLN